MNARQWQRAPRPLSRDSAAALAEYPSMGLLLRETGRDLYRDFTDPAAKRNLRASKTACEEIRREAERRMLTRAGSEDRARPP